MHSNQTVYVKFTYCYDHHFKDDIIILINYRKVGTRKQLYEKREYT